MSYKLKHDSIAVFSKEVSNKVCDNIFQETDEIDGNRLMSITGSKQTNLLVLKALFEAWNKETDKLKSPYFDFSNADVQEALRTFMNILSRHILVKRTDLEPIIESAVNDSVFIHFDPKEYYSDRLLADLEENVSTDELMQLKKYLKVNEEPFWNELEGLGGGSISKNALERNVQEAYDKANLSPSTPERFLDELGCAEYLDSLFEKEIEQEEELTPEPRPIVEEVNGDPVLNEKFNNSKATVADELKKKVVKDIESSLSLNEKFMFINNLFDGDKENFKNALSDIENSSGLEDAKMKVQTQYGSDWDFESEEAEAFIHVLERRFV